MAVCISIILYWCIYFVNLKGRTLPELPECKRPTITDCEKYDCKSLLEGLHSFTELAPLTRPKLVEMVRKSHQIHIYISFNRFARDFRVDKKDTLFGRFFQ